MILGGLKKGLLAASVVLVVFIILGVFSMLGMNKEEIYRKTFSIEPGTNLEAYSNMGSIDVSDWDRDYVEVVGVKHSNWLTRLFKLQGNIDVTTGRELVVRSNYRTSFFCAVPIEILIKVPREMQIARLETSTGAIKMTNVSGNVKAKTSTGAIQVENVSGDIDVKTSTGAIKIRKVDGFVRAEAGTGSIDIAGAEGIHGVRTSTGAITVEVPSFRDSLDIKAGTGGITAYLAPDLAAELEVSTSLGKINFEDLAITVSQTSGKKLVGKLGDGGGKIAIETSTGAISLKKLR